MVSEGEKGSRELEMKKTLRKHFKFFLVSVRSQGNATKVMENYRYSEVKIKLYLLL